MQWLFALTPDLTVPECELIDAGRLKILRSLRCRVQRSPIARTFQLFNSSPIELASRHNKGYQHRRLRCISGC